MRHASSVLLFVALGCAIVSAETAASDSTADLRDLSVTGNESTTFERFYEHVTSKNRSLDEYYARRLFEIYVSECTVEGVSLVVALSQMIHETDFLLFSGSVRPTQYNYAGMGSTAIGVSGNDFGTMARGIRAHVQHLKAYGDAAPLSQELVDPRFHYVVRGSAPTVMALAGRWAADPDYGPKVLAHAHKLVIRATGQESE